MTALPAGVKEYEPLHAVPIGFRSQWHTTFAIRNLGSHNKGISGYAPQVVSNVSESLEIIANNGSVG